MISVRRQNDENNTIVILNQEYLIMRNKICETLIKESKGNKVTWELEWAMYLCEH